MKKLGWDVVPAIIKDFNDTETASVALIENLTARRAYLQLKKQWLMESYLNFTI